MTSIQDQVHQYLKDNFFMGSQGVPLTPQTSFISAHVLDSTGFLELVTYLEENFGIQVEDDEMVPENLDSLDAIAAYVERKKSA